MPTRLQVTLDDRELAAIELAARRRHMTTSAWVRQALREAQRNDLRGDANRKLAVVRAAAEYTFPTGDVSQILDEIERGH